MPFFSIFFALNWMFPKNQQWIADTPSQGVTDGNDINSFKILDGLTILFI